MPQRYNLPLNGYSGRGNPALPGGNHRMMGEFYNGTISTKDLS